MNKNLRKKALLPAIAMVLASVLALSGVTYAWFTTGNVASVGTLDVNVQTADGIQISLDAQTWKSQITAEDIIAAIGKSNVNIQFPEDEIAPVSTAGNVVNGKMEMFKGTLNNGKLTSTAEIETNGRGGNYIAFDLYFKTAGLDKELTLKVGSTQSYVKCVDLSANRAESEVGTEKAVRVAFLPMGTAQTAAAARGLTMNGNASLIWEPNSTTRAPSVEGDEGQLPYKGLNAAFGATALDQITDAADVTTFDGEKVITSLKAGINKIRVYIWLEGQDVDCVNEISFADFTTNLYFSVPETVEGEGN